MNVSLTPELEEMVNRKVESGLYGSASEVVLAGLRLLEEEDELRQVRFEELRREILKGVAQIERGESIPGEEVFERIRKQNEERLRNRV